MNSHSDKGIHIGEAYKGDKKKSNNEKNTFHCIKYNEFM